MSKKHLHRYLNELVGRFNSRDLELDERMALVVLGMVGKELSYAALTSSCPQTGRNSNERAFIAKYHPHFLEHFKQMRGLS